MTETMRGRAFHRTILELTANAAEDADRLTYLIKRSSPKIRVEAAASITAGWTRRHLLDVALELARRDALGTDRPSDRRRNKDHTYQARQQQHADKKRQARRDRVLAEEARWTNDEAYAAHLAYANGTRTDWAKEGRRVFWRRFHGKVPTIETTDERQEA